MKRGYSTLKCGRLVNAITFEFSLIALNICDDPQNRENNTNLSKDFGNICSKPKQTLYGAWEQKCLTNECSPSRH